MVYEEEEESNHGFAFGEKLGRSDDGDFWIIPAYWFYDVGTGEFINEKSGVVVNRKCFLAVCGVVNEYAIEPEKMICGEIVLDAQHVHICNQSYTHPKSPSKFLHSHRTKNGYAWE
jgi:hypothetical protein